MHFILGFQINDSSRDSEIQRAIESVLKPYPWVRPLHSIYVINANTQYDWNIIVQNLTNVAKQHPTQFSFVASPLMLGGNYAGWLPQNLWPLISEQIAK